MNDNLNNLAQDPRFCFIDHDEIESERIVAPRYSYWRSVFRVFFRKKVNYVMLALLFLILVASFIFPIFMPFVSGENILDAKTLNKSPKQAITYMLEREGAAAEAEGKTLTTMQKAEIVFKYCLGTGSNGNSIMYNLFSASRTSLLLCFICAAINMTVGVLVGAVWGYSKRFDSVMLVIYNIIANVPYILMISVLVYVIGAGFWSFIFALTVTGWLWIAFPLRTQVMIIRDREYSLASRCLGTPIPRMVTRNILPFMTSVIVTILATELPSYISMEVFLSYIGVGLSAKVPSLGHMINNAQTGFITMPWAIWPPVAIASAITIILYVLGQNLADASDPRTHM